MIRLIKDLATKIRLLNTLRWDGVIVILCRWFSQFLDKHKRRAIIANKWLEPITLRKNSQYWQSSINSLIPLGIIYFTKNKAITYEEEYEKLKTDLLTVSEKMEKLETDTLTHKKLAEISHKEIV